MKLSEWRSKLTQFLEQQLPVDSWFLDRPTTYTEVVGMLPPLAQMQVSVRQRGSYTLEATQEVLVVRRFPKALSYQQLPFDQLQGLYSDVAIYTSAFYQGISDDVSKLNHVAVDRPIAVEEITEGRGDWMLVLRWLFEVELEVDPEDLPETDFVLRSIGLTLWSQNIDSSVEPVKYKDINIQG